MKLFKKEIVKKGSYLRKIVRVCGIKFSLGRELDITSILNAVVDITKCPQATGNLRKLQLADLLLLRIVHCIFKKHNIPYALAFGNLLGAVRHKGFIPWDDDMDIWVLDHDYEKAIAIVQQELKDTNFEFFGVEKSRLGDITFRISHKEIPGINLDIFYMFPSKYDDTAEKEIHKHWDEVHRDYAKQYKRIKKSETKEKLDELRNGCDDKFKGGIAHCGDTEAKSYINNTSVAFRMCRAADFYPFSTIEFEGFEFSAPHNAIGVLTSIYGDYMSFPKSFFQHSDIFKQFDGQKMDAVITELKELLKKFEK